MRVIAKAYGGEPLQRICTGCTDKLAYVMHPSKASAIGIIKFYGVGFPLSDVFEFDLPVFDSLCQAWKSRDPVALAHAWSIATPIAKKAMRAA